MKESEVKIITVMLEALPKMSDVQKAKLLGYGEAIVDLKEEMQKKAKEEKIKQKAKTEKLKLILF